MANRVHLNIPGAHFHNILSWDQETIDQLVDKAVDLAVKTGLRLDEDKEGVYLREAECKGAGIDWDNQAVMFTREQVEQTMDVMRKTEPVPDPLRPLSLCEEGRDVEFLVGNGANMPFDWESWNVRPAKVEDLIELSQWAQGNDNVSSFVQPVMLKDCNLFIEPLYSYAIMAKYCRKNVYHNQPTEPIHVKYMDKMARVVEKHRGYFQPVAECEYINPPFRLSRRAIDTMFARVDLGVCKTMCVGPMSVAGMSAPVTAPGLAVTAVAEILAGLTFFNITRPGFGLKTVVCTGSLDLSNARVNYYGMHAHLCNLAAWELLVRGIGVDSPCLTWYREANEPGLQAAYEFGMATAFFSSVLIRCNPEIGGLSCGNIFSPHQAVMDMEIAKESNELMHGFEVDVSDEALGLEEMGKTRFEQGAHMASEHTLKHMMDGVPFSSYFFKGMPAGAQHDKDHTQTQELMEKAAESVKASIAKGREVELDEALGNELYELVKQAAAELGIDAPAMV